jgi:predicted nucleic acid-binding protein
MIADREGRSANTMDAFLAAMAELHHLTVVTHNIADFRS